jgi:hypothetical protein
MALQKIRDRLTDALTALDVQLGTLVRYLCALKKWRISSEVLELEFADLSVLFQGQILPRTLDGLGQ